MKKMLFDVHVQKGQYGYMFGKIEASNKKKAAEIGASKWDNILRYNKNPYTQNAFKTLKKSQYNINVMPVDAMKGTIMFEDFGKFPSGTKQFVRDNYGKLKEVI